MGKASREGGLYYINDVAVDAEGKKIENAPKRPADTDPSKQPGSVGASTPEERMGIAIANALRGKANTPSSEGKDSEDAELPTLADLEDHLSDLTIDEVRALQKSDDRKGAVAIYEARIEELEAK